MPSIVDTQAGGNYYSVCPLRRLAFYANGRYWVFFRNGGVSFRSSTDGITWTPRTEVFWGSVVVAIWFDGVYVHYVRTGAEWQSAGTSYRRGIPEADGSITWSADEQVVNWDNIELPNITVDSNGFPWITYHIWPDVGSTWVSKSSTNDGTWVTAPGFPYELSPADPSLRLTLPVALTGGKVYCIYAWGGGASRGRLWDGAGWSAEEYCFPGLGLAGNISFSVVAEGDDIHLVTNSWSPWPLPNYTCWYNKRTYGVGWDEPVNVGNSNLDLYCGTVLTIHGGELHVFVGAASAIYHKGHNGGWPVDYRLIVDETTDGLDRDDAINVFSSAPDGKAGLVYVVNSPEGHSLKFALVTLPLAPVVSTGAATDVTETDATLHGTISDDGGEACEISFEYGPNTDYGSTTPWMGSYRTGDAFSQAISVFPSILWYHFRARARNSAGMTVGEDKVVSPLPVVTTQPVTDTKDVTATGNGTITQLGFPNPNQHGHCWNTVGNPTIADDKTENGPAVATGAFTSAMAGLIPNTRYYIRAYATNIYGTAYGEEVTFKTAGGFTLEAIATGLFDEQYESSYEATHDAPSSYSATARCVIAQFLFPAPQNYSIIRSSVIFDTRPYSGVVLAATLWLCCDGLYEEPGVHKTCVVKAPNMHDPQDPTDYGDIGSHNDIVGEAGFDYGWSEIEITDLSAITLGGLTKLGLRLDSDINGQAPTSGEGWIIASVKRVPRLTVNYTVDGNPHQVVLKATKAAMLPQYAGSYGELYTYMEMHDATEGYEPGDMGYGYDLGQTYDYYGPGDEFWQLQRDALFFDTSDIPADAVIVSAVLDFWCFGDYSDNEFDIVIVDGSGLSDPTVKADYGYLRDQVISFGSVNTVGIQTDTWTSITLNALGLAAIVKEGTTKFGLRSSRDIAAIDPKPDPPADKYEYLDIDGEPVNPPRLVLVIQTVPVVTTDPASPIGTVDATLNGTLNDDGGEACDCGFEWGETDTYGNTTPTQSGTSGQSFLQAITGLNPGTTYHFRAFATSPSGAGYGDDRTFTTKKAPVVKTYGVTNIELDSAVLIGELTDDGGEACEVGFEWGLTALYGKVTTWQGGKHTGDAFWQIIASLEPDTSYHFRAQAKNSAGATIGADMTFKTLARPEAEVIEALYSVLNPSLLSLMEEEPVFI